MNVVINLNEEQMGDLARAVVVEMEKAGKVMVEPERLRPFTMAEAVGEFGVSKDTISRWGEAGMLDRVPGTSRVLFTAASVRRKMKGEL